MLACGACHRRSRRGYSGCKGFFDGHRADTREVTRGGKCGMLQVPAAAVLAENRWWEVAQRLRLQCCLAFDVCVAKTWQSRA
jgi:hypothetical protein